MSLATDTLATVYNELVANQEALGLTKVTDSSDMSGRIRSHSAYVDFIGFEYTEDYPVKIYSYKLVVVVKIGQDARASKAELLTMVNDIEEVLLAITGENIQPILLSALQYYPATINGTHYHVGEITFNSEDV